MNIYQVLNSFFTLLFNLILNLTYFSFCVVIVNVLRRFIKSLSLNILFGGYNFFKSSEFIYQSDGCNSQIFLFFNWGFPFFSHIFYYLSLSFCYNFNYFSFRQINFSCFNFLKSGLTNLFFLFYAYWLKSLLSILYCLSFYDLHIICL